MLFRVVDDRSGVSDMEYRCVYGEDAESALRFLFHALAPKADPAFPFQRIFRLEMRELIDSKRQHRKA